MLKSKNESDAQKKIIIELEKGRVADKVEQDLRLKTREEFILKECQRECQKQVAQSKLEILAEVLVKIDEQIIAYDSKKDLVNVQKIADAIAGQKKQTTEDISTLRTEIMTKIGNIPSHTNDIVGLIKWQEQVKQDIGKLD